MKGSMKTIILYLVIFAILMAVCFAFLSNSKKQEAITFGEAVELFKDKKVEEFSINNANVLIIKTTDKTEHGTSIEYTHKLRSIELFLYNETVNAYIEEQLALPKEERTLKIDEWDVEALKETPWIVALLPGLIIVVILIVFYMYMMNKAGDAERRMNAFGKSRAKMHSKEKDRKFFSDVAGCDEEKKNSASLWNICATPANSAVSAQRFRTAFCSSALPERVKPCLPKRLRAKQTFLSSPFRVPISWKCTSVSALPV